jgi:hypothetical protein
MLLFSPRWLFLKPGFALMLIGLVLGACLLPGPLTLGRVTLDVHTLLFCAIAVLIGFQSVIFAVLTKVFAMQSGLRPREPAFERLMNWITLEAGLLTGAVMIASGLALSLIAVAQWTTRQFGPLSPAETLRWVIPGGLLLALGCQTILSSCFLGILGLKLSK